MSDNNRGGTIQLYTTGKADAATKTATLSLDGGETKLRFNYTVNDDRKVDFQPDSTETYKVRSLVPASVERSLYRSGEKPRWHEWAVTKVSSSKTADELRKAPQSSFNWTFE